MLQGRVNTRGSTLIGRLTRSLYAAIHTITGFRLLPSECLLHSFWQAHTFPASLWRTAYYFLSSAFMPPIIANLAGVVNQEDGSHQIIFVLPDEVIMLTMTNTIVLMQRAKKPALIWTEPRATGSILLRMRKNTRNSPTIRPQTAPSLLAFSRTGRVR